MHWTRLCGLSTGGAISLADAPPPWMEQNRTAIKAVLSLVLECLHIRICTCDNSFVSCRLNESTSFTHINISVTYTVVNAVHEVKQFLAAGFCGFFATGDSIRTPLKLLSMLLAVLVLATFISQNFLRILHIHMTCYAALDIHTLSGRDIRQLMLLLTVLAIKGSSPVHLGKMDNQKSS